MNVDWLGEAPPDGINSILPVAPTIEPLLFTFETLLQVTKSSTLTA